MTIRLGVAGAHLDGFSGVPKNLTVALRDKADVIVMDLGKAYSPGLPKRVFVRLGRLLGREYLWEKERARCRYYGRRLEVLLTRQELDAVLLFGSEVMAYTTHRTPTFAFGDSIFGTRVDYYEDQTISRIWPSSVREGVDVQQRALQKLRTFFMTSKWAWERALSRFEYRASSTQLQVVLVGSNLPHISEPVPLPPADALRLVWVGVDWHRKGGGFAVEVVRCLRERGVDAQIEIVGPVTKLPAPEWVNFRGPLFPSGGLEQAYDSATALLLPTRADLTPIAIAEAASRGRPTIAPPLGGIPEMLTSGENALLIEGDCETWASTILETSRSGRMTALAAAARSRYEKCLNWPVIAQSIVDRIESDLA